MQPVSFMPEIKQPQSSQRETKKRSRDEAENDDDQYCEIVEIHTPKRARTSSSQSLFRNIFNKVFGWVKQASNSHSRIFGWESNSAADAIAHGGQYLDEASTDKFMPTTSHSTAGNGFGVVKSQPFVPKPSTGLPAIHIPRKQLAQGVLHGGDNSLTRKHSCSTSAPTQKTVSISFSKHESHSTNGLAKNKTVRHSLANHNSSAAAHLDPIKTTAVKPSPSTADTEIYNDNDSLSFGSCEIGNGTLQKCYQDKAVKVKQPSHQSVYDQTFTEANSTNKTAAKGPEKCFDLEEKERYKRLLQQFCLNDVSVQQHSLGRLSTGPMLSEFSWRRNIFNLASTKPSLPNLEFTKSSKENTSHLSVSDKLIPSVKDKTSTATEPDNTIAKHSSVRSLVNSFKEEQEPEKPSNITLKCDALVRQIEQLKEKAVSRLAEQRKLAQTEEILLTEYEKRRKDDDDYLKLLVEQRLSLTPKVILDELPPEDKEDAYDEFPELDEEAEDRVTKAFSSGPNTVLAEGFRLKITRTDMHTLKGLNWLNDEIINFYFCLIQDRSEKTDLPKVYVFNSFFYQTLMEHGHARLKRWTKQVDIFSKDLILIPVHLGMHWCLACINFKERTIKYYDSMGGKNWACIEALKKYLEDESLDKKNRPFNASNWNYECVRDIPQQMNGSDCGVFSCKYAEYLSREAQFTFTQENMPYFRRRMVYEIIKKELL